MRTHKFSGQKAMALLYINKGFTQKLHEVSKGKGEVVPVLN
jgi:hypothetical protein